MRQTEYLSECLCVFRCQVIKSQVHSLYCLWIKQDIKPGADKRAALSRNTLIQDTKLILSDKKPT